MTADDRRPHVTKEFVVAHDWFSDGRAAENAERKSPTATGRPTHDELNAPELDADLEEGVSKIRHRDGSVEPTDKDSCGVASRRHHQPR